MRLSLEKKCPRQESNLGGMLSQKPRLAGNAAQNPAQLDARERLGGARDDGLNRLIELWPMLSELDRLALVDHAEHLVALRSGGEAVAGLDGGDASESRLSASGGSGQATARPVKGRGKRDAGERRGVDSSLR